MDFYSREIQIMRQSQIKMALDYLSSVGVSVTVEELDRITDLFVELCLRPKDDELRKRLEPWVEKMNKQKPSNKKEAMKVSEDFINKYIESFLMENQNEI